MKSLFGVVKYGSFDELKRLFPEKSVTPKQLINQIKVLSRKKEYYASPKKTPLQLIFDKTRKEYNLLWPQENYLRHFYATYLFCIQPPDNYELRDTPFNDIIFHQLQKYL